MTVELWWSKPIAWFCHFYENVRGGECNRPMLPETMLAVMSKENSCPADK